MHADDGQPAILVGVSGSSASLAALRWAAVEARRRDARLRVIQAWEPHPARAPYAAAQAGDVPSAGTAAGQLAGLVRATIGDPAGAVIDVEVVAGPPERVLVDASADAGLLVLGSGGQAPFAPSADPPAERPVGPVIRACLSHAHCPVLVISPAVAAGLEHGQPALAGTAR
ncbi:MAG: universal stress protein [Streptosporangiaceae bacterium]